MSGPKEECRARFQGSISDAVGETVQIKLVLALFYGRVGLQVPLQPRSFLSRVTPAQSIIDLRCEHGAGL